MKVCVDPATEKAGAERPTRGQLHGNVSWTSRSIPRGSRVEKSCQALTTAGTNNPCPRKAEGEKCNGLKTVGLQAPKENNSKLYSKFWHSLFYWSFACFVLTFVLVIFVFCGLFLFSFFL